MSECEFMTERGCGLWVVDLIDSKFLSEFHVTSNAIKSDFIPAKMMMRQEDFGSYVTRARQLAEERKRQQLPISSYSSVDADDDVDEADHVHAHQMKSICDSDSSEDPNDKSFCVSPKNQNQAKAEVVDVTDGGAEHKTDLKPERVPLMDYIKSLQEAENANMERLYNLHVFADKLETEHPSLDTYVTKVCKCKISAGNDNVQYTFEGSGPTEAIAEDDAFRKMAKELLPLELEYSMLKDTASAN